MRIGPYELGERLGRGGMGEVLVGRKVGPSGFGRLVAIKRLHPHLASEPNARAMFLAEGRLAAHIRHAKVVATLDIAEPEDGSLLLVMDFVDGISLASLLTRLRDASVPLPPNVASALVVDMLEGLHAAHETRGDDGASLGIIHRDVSPQNVLVGRDGIARVIDFGIARAAESIAPHHTATGEIKGKLAYMAPEQAAGSDITRAIDIYAAGAVLWECLTLRRFRAGDDDAKIAQILLPDIDPPSRFARGLAPEVDDVVMKALSARPNQRFPTALAMADALAKALPPASARDVAAFIAAHVPAQSLPALSTPRIEETGDPTATAVTVPLPPRPKTMRFVALGAGVIAIGGLAMIAPRFFPVSAPPAPSPPVEPVVAASAPPPPSGEPEPEPEPSAAPSSPTPTKRRKIAPKSKDPCAVPYELDDNGLRRYKRECIR